MLAVLRTFLVMIYGIFVCLIGTVYCLFNPRNSRNVYFFGRFFRKISKALGLKVIVRQPDVTSNQPVVYVANHQSNYDLVMCAYVFQPHTVTIGKKSLLWVPFFGLLYWLTGNLLIERNNKSKAHSMIKQVVQTIDRKKVSIWMFPEGTRSRGRKLLPFKTGAFHAAIEAKVAIVPICISNLHNKIDLNRRDNGYVIVEMLPAIDTSSYERHQARELAQQCHHIMAHHIQTLNQEVAALESSSPHLPTSDKE